MSHIFVSYKRDDLETVSKIVDELKRHHYVWFDSGIPGGTEWEAEIKAGLDAAAALVLMVTPAALTSKWVRYEYETALARGIRVIPYMLERAELPDNLHVRQKIKASDEMAFEKLMDALPNDSRIWGAGVIPPDALTPESTFAEIAQAYPDGILQPSLELVGLPLHQTRYCKVYLVGKRDDTHKPLDNYQLALQLTSRQFGLQPAADGAYPQDDFVRDVAAHFLTSPSQRIRLYLVRGPLNQPYTQPDRLGFGLNVKRESEWLDVAQAADYARSHAKGGLMQLFVNGPAIMTYRLGASNPGFSRYELYQLDYQSGDYHCVLRG